MEHAGHAAAGKMYVLPRPTHPVVNKPSQYHSRLCREGDQRILKCVGDAKIQSGQSASGQEQTPRPCGVGTCTDTQTTDLLRKCSVGETALGHPHVHPRAVKWNSKNLTVYKKLI